MAVDEQVETTTLPRVNGATEDRTVSTLLQLCVFVQFTGPYASRHLVPSPSSGIFIYELLLAINRMIFFSVKKFVQRKFSPLTEKFLTGKNYCRDRSERKQFLNTR